jgi:hypothetical protein
MIMTEPIPVDKIVAPITMVLEDRLGRVLDKITAHIEEEETYRRYLEGKMDALVDVLKTQQDLLSVQKQELAHLSKLVERYKGATGMLALVLGAAGTLIGFALNYFHIGRP